MQISKNEENQPTWNPFMKEIKLEAYLNTPDKPSHTRSSQNLSCCLTLTIF